MGLILQMSKLRLRKERSLAQSCSANKVLNSCFHVPLSMCNEPLSGLSTWPGVIAFFSNKGKREGTKDVC